MRLLLAAILVLSPLAAAAEDTLDADQFDARTLGRTITYSRLGEVYGTEEYLPGRRVRWAFTGGSCKEGSWFQRESYICFAYDTRSDLQCWTFTETDAGLVARFMGDAEGDPLVALRESPLPLACAGPDVGV
ncbi:hypothetical protein [Phaeovulum sp.]|jgi:hypothetical protein|uniref:hypothetical protein n=1 Tax=Phaeovulum sp. TaxID=2934796 RepID=UPI002730A7F4|nr:hypothetical protein [Phaeovulum sp.]MDP1667553.1 hypothetical protein [Phaeovulum sp.]MDP3860577.1 hypothetical protein [Phaeovulum sp.]MDZ4120070.1 hypothetical protein [Phaeovulum sp.]